jgi:heme A synthase
MSGYARLATVSAVGVYLLIVFGAVVRVTGSGLGCPDWPLCHGRLVPPAETTAIIEYVHRTVAAVVGLPLTGLFVATWLRQRHARSVFWSVNLLMLLLIPRCCSGARSSCASCRRRWSRSTSPTRSRSWRSRS